MGPDVFEGRADAALKFAAGLSVGGEEALADCFIGLLGGAGVLGVGGIGVLVEGDVHLACAVTVVVVDWDAGAVDGQLLEVGAAVAVELSVQVGEETALEERILCEVDTADNVARLELKDISDLFIIWKIWYIP